MTEPFLFAFDQTKPQKDWRTRFSFRMLEHLDIPEGESPLLPANRRSVVVHLLQDFPLLKSMTFTPTYGDSTTYVLARPRHRARSLEDSLPKPEVIASTSQSIVAYF